MHWNNVTLKCMLQPVYQLCNINFYERPKKLSLLFSDLQCCAITILAIWLQRLRCKIKIIAYNPVHKLFNYLLNLYDLVK